MQGVGATKGGNDISYHEILQQTKVGLDNMLDRELANEVAQVLPKPFPLYFNYMNVNMRDQIRDGSDVPLQFVYEAADCRLFYTGTMIKDLTAVWEEVAEVTWRGKRGCVKGSTGHPSALPVKMRPVFREADVA